MRTVPLASQEAAGAIEAYHIKLKTKVFDDSHLGAFQRVDWLVHKLTAELHSSYWLDRYSDEHDTFKDVKEMYLASTSWHRALQISDTAVCFHENHDFFAEIQSQKDNTVSHIVWNPGSEFAFCNCAWALQGNLCKHVIKVNMMYETRQGSASMSFHSFRELLTSLLRKPMDDSIELDKAMAWTHQMLNQVQSLVELTSANNIGTVVKSLPLKWISKKARTTAQRPLATSAPVSSSANTKSNVTGQRGQKKRKRLSTLR